MYFPVVRKNNIKHFLLHKVVTEWLLVTCWVTQFSDKISDQLVNVPCNEHNWHIYFSYSIPPDCHHEKRENHKCHFGDCPPCHQVCNKERSTCPHKCNAACHSAVLVKIEAQKASMPWEQTKPQLEKRALPCPDCMVPVPVTCLGKSISFLWKCFCIMGNFHVHLYIEV